MKNKRDELGNIMHGLSEQNLASDAEVYENMPSFPRISRNKNLTLLLLSEVKNYEVINNECRFYVKAVYIDEKYTYRYFDYRQVFVQRENTSTIMVSIKFSDLQTIRLRMEEGFQMQDHNTEMLSDWREEEVPIQVTEENGEIRIENGINTVIVQKSPWNMRIEDQEGKTVYRQMGKDEHSYMPYEICPMGFLYDNNTGKRYACEAVCSYTYESVYGLGENFSGSDRRGRHFDLWNTNALGVNTERGYKYIPFYYSTIGYGLYFNTSAPIRCDMGESLSKANSFMIEDTGLDMFIILAKELKEVIPRYFKLTGNPSVPPKWTFGLWISKISYRTREEVETVAKKMREHQIPCDVIHIDTDWFAENWVCDWKFDKTRFPKPEEMTKNLHKQGYKISLWQLPYIERGNYSTEVYDEGVREGYFAEKPNGDMQFPHGLIDFSNPEAVVWYKEKLIKPLLRQGIDVIKVDFGESAPDFFKYAGAKSEEMHNLYALLYNKAVYEAMEEELGKEKAVIWARSAWAGSQKYPVHWGGDAGTDFASLENSMKGCLNASVSGIPFWSSDLGGFWFDSNPVLYIRWFQFGMFCSHARLHGFYSREPWDFGEEAVNIVRKYAQFRYRLIPYIYNEALKVGKKQTLMHRPLVYEYPEDFFARTIDTEYLFGENILVAPVLNEEGRVQVYLPEGSWTDYFTEEKIQGPCTFEKTEKLEEMPVYIRENALIPMGPVTQYIGEENAAISEVHCYPCKGANSLRLYESNIEIFMESDDDKILITGSGIENPVKFAIHGVKVLCTEINGKEVYGNWKQKVYYLEINDNTTDLKLTVYK